MHENQFQRPLKVAVSPKISEIIDDFPVVTRETVETYDFYFSLPDEGPINPVVEKFAWHIVVETPFRAAMEMYQFLIGGLEFKGVNKDEFYRRFRTGGYQK